MLFERAQIEQDETVLKIVRKHWFVLLSETFICFVLFALPYIGFVLVEKFFGSTTLFNTATAHHLTLYLIAAWSLLIFIMFWTLLTDYYLDVWIITSRRIVAIDQKGFFNRVISSFRLERLQDINIEMSGIIATALDFGNLETQTAGENNIFIIRGIPKPREIKSLILNAADAHGGKIDPSREQSETTL